MKWFSRAEKPPVKPPDISTHAKIAQAMDKEPKKVELEGPMATLFEKCGDSILFQEAALEVLEGVKTNFEKLLEKYPEKGIPETMKHTRDSLLLLVSLLNKLCKFTEDGYPNNNLNLFISEDAHAFYTSIGDTLDINNDLAAEAGEILWTALKENSFSSQIFPGFANTPKRLAYKAYTLLSGDQIDIATTYIRAKLDGYPMFKEVRENDTLINAAKGMNSWAEHTVKTAQNQTTHAKAIKFYSNTLSSIRESNFQFGSETPAGLRLVLSGVALKSLAICQNAILKQEVPTTGVVPIKIKLPPAANEKRFEAFKSKISSLDQFIIQECKKMHKTKKVPQQEREVFDLLIINIDNLQSKAASQKQPIKNIAMDLLRRYEYIAAAIEANAVWDATPEGTALLKECAVRIKEIIADYSLDITAKELTTEEKQAVTQPEETVQKDGPRNETKLAAASSEENTGKAKEEDTKDENQRPHI